MGNLGDAPLNSQLSELYGGTDNTSYTDQQFLWWTTSGGKVASSGYGPSSFEQPANKGVANGYCGLDAAAKVATTNLGGAGATGYKYLRGDQTWAIPGHFYDVKEYGGAHGDGSSDDYQHIQDTLDAAYTAGGGVVYVPASTNPYMTSDTLKVPTGVRLIGAGSDGSTGKGSCIKLANDVQQTVIEMDHWSTVEHLEVDGNASENDDDSAWWSQDMENPGTVQGTSATSKAIGTGSWSPTVSSGMCFNTTTCNYIKVVSRANSANYMQGTVTAYSGTSMTINVTVTGGSGTYSDWDLYVLGPPMAQGIATCTVWNGGSSSNYCYIHDVYIHDVVRSCMYAPGSYNCWDTVRVENSLTDHFVYASGNYNIYRNIWCTGTARESGIVLGANSTTATATYCLMDGVIVYNMRNDTVWDAQNMRAINLRAGNGNNNTLRNLFIYDDGSTGTPNTTDSSYVHIGQPNSIVDGLQMLVPGISGTNQTKYAPLIVNLPENTAGGVTMISNAIIRLSEDNTTSTAYMANIFSNCIMNNVHFESTGDENRRGVRIKNTDEIEGNYNRVLACYIYGARIDVDTYGLLAVQATTSLKYGFSGSLNMTGGTPVYVYESGSPALMFLDCADALFRNSGSATIPSGSTSVEVTHGLAFTPGIGEVMVTPTNGMGSASEFWVSGYASDHFHINVNTDPSTPTATFAWMACKNGA